MSISRALHDSHRRRPYWLLLVLALFLAGQAAAAGHWHDGGAQADSDCALCLFAGAGSAALTGSGWQPLAICLGITVFLILTGAPRRSAVRFHDSRAPPAYLIDV